MNNSKIKIFIYYNITNKPWGGGNSFLKAFRNYILTRRSDEFEIVEDINEDYDIFFMNGGHKDQGVYIDLKEITRINKVRFWQKKRKPKKIIYRLDGARFKYNRSKSVMDDLQFKAAMMADHILFQSNECVYSFKELGYDGKNYSIIYNGVNQGVFNPSDSQVWDEKSKLKVFSCNWSSNQHKGYSTIAAFSEHPDVECAFVGNWNNETDPRNVNLSPPVPQEELVGAYKNNHVFLHPAEHDPCPNVVLEALSCGMPIIYHNSGGTNEIAVKYGVPLPSNISDSSINDTIIRMRTEYVQTRMRIQKNISNFSIEWAGNEYLRTFKEVLRSE